jgi:hypothetical protein
MSDAKTLLSMSMKDEASAQLRKFMATYRQTLNAVENDGGGGGQGMAQLAVQVTSLEGAMTMLGMTAPQVGIAMAALNFGGQAVEAARSAAQVQAVETAFTRLAGSVGASGVSMLAAMQAASSGMISDMDLMLAANTAMALGVADNSEEMTSLLQVAIAKGAELGVAPMKAFGDLINGLGRMSPEILNNIGVVVDAQAAYDAYAQSIGVTVKQLNEQQKMQALVNAVLAANPDAARQAAEAGDSAAAAFARWDVATQQFSQSFGAVFLPVIAAGLEQVTRFVNAVGGLGDAMVLMAEGGITQTPEQLDAIIADAQAQIAKLSDTSIYTPSAGVDSQIAYYRDQIAMAEQAKRLLTGATAAVTAATEQEGAAMGQAAQATAMTKEEAWHAAGAWLEFAAQAGVAGRSSEYVRERLAALAGQSDATSGALRSMWIGAAGALGAATAFSGWQKQQKELDVLVQTWSQYGRMSGEQLEFAKAAWLDEQNAALMEQVQALTAVDTAAGRAASGGLSDFDSRLSSIRSSVESSVQAMVSSALDLSDISWPGQDGPAASSGDAINENAKRLAAIANEGLIGQDWLGEFAAEVPDIFAALTASADPKAAAAQLLTEFQQGLRPELLDFEMIKQRVRDELTSQQAIAAMTGELTSQLMAELGVSAAQVQSAMAGLGLPSTGTGAADTDQFGSGFEEGIDAQATAAGSLAKIAKAFLENESNVRASGGVVGAWWGEGFMAVVGDNVPPGLLDMLTSKLLPLILAGIAQRNSTSGTSDGN